MKTNDPRDPSESDYRNHMRALEQCAARLEGGELDPQEALEAYREAQTHYEAVDRILGAVEDEVSKIRQEDERPIDK